MNRLLFHERNPTYRSNYIKMVNIHTFAWMQKVLRHLRQSLHIQIGLTCEKSFIEKTNIGPHIFVGNWHGNNMSKVDANSRHHERSERTLKNSKATIITQNSKESRMDKIRRAKIERNLKIQLDACCKLIKWNKNKLNLVECGHVMLPFDLKFMFDNFQAVWPFMDSFKYHQCLPHCFRFKLFLFSHFPSHSFDWLEY